MRTNEFEIASYVFYWLQIQILIRDDAKWKCKSTGNINEVGCCCDDITQVRRKHLPEDQLIFFCFRKAQSPVQYNFQRSIDRTTNNLTKAFGLLALALISKNLLYSSRAILRSRQSTASPLQTRCYYRLNIFVGTEEETENSNFTNKTSKREIYHHVRNQRCRSTCH